MRYNWSNASQKPKPSYVLHAGSRSRTWQRFSETLFAKSISVRLLEPGQVFLQGTNQLKNIGELLPERQVRLKRLNKLFNGPWILVAYCQIKKRISCFQNKMLGLDNLPVTQFEYWHCKFAAWVLACNSPWWTPARPTEFRMLFWTERLFCTRQCCVISREDTALSFLGYKLGI